MWFCDGMKQFVAYARVSSAQKQKIDGLGIDAQNHSVAEYVKQQGGVIVASYTEAESGGNNDRPMLAQAMATAKKHKACLLVARLDRLSRDSVFLITLKKSELEFRCVDMPELDNFSVSLYAILAERERSLASIRTRAALAAAKRRGVKLGSPDPERSVKLMLAGGQAAKNAFKAKMLPVINEIKATGVKTLQGVADALTRRGYTTRQGKTTWHAGSVRYLTMDAAA